MKPGSNRLKKAYALIAASCLCTGSLLILKSFWELYTGTLTAGAADAPAAFFLPGLTETESIRAEFFYSPGCLLLFSAVCLLLITWSEEKRLRLPVWGGLFLLTILAGLFVFLRGRNITGISSSEAAIPSVNPAAARELYLLFVITALFVLLCGFMAYISLGRLWLKGLILLFQISILVVYAVFRISFSKLGIALILFCLLLFMAETAACFINRGKERACLFLFPSIGKYTVSDAGLPRRRPAPHPDPCGRKTGALGHAAFDCRRTGRKNKCPACPYQLYFFRKQGYLRPFFHWLQR